VRLRALSGHLSAGQAGGADAARAESAAAARASQSAQSFREKGILAKLFIVEYNAKFPPPIEFQIDYDPRHTWAHDDYYGASLSSFDRLFSRFGYRLVCCNAHTGANAFFVDADHAERMRLLATAARRNGANAPCGTCSRQSSARRR
jgi:hypothetical protein